MLDRHFNFVVSRNGLHFQFKTLEMFLPCHSVRKCLMRGFRRDKNQQILWIEGKMSFMDFCIAEVDSLEKMRRKTRGRRASGGKNTHCWNLWQQILELVERTGCWMSQQWLRDCERKPVGISA